MCVRCTVCFWGFSLQASMLCSLPVTQERREENWAMPRELTGHAEIFLGVELSLWMTISHTTSSILEPWWQEGAVGSPGNHNHAVVPSDGWQQAPALGASCWTSSKEQAAYCTELVECPPSATVDCCCYQVLVRLIKWKQSILCDSRSMTGKYKLGHSSCFHPRGMWTLVPCWHLKWWHMQCFNAKPS